MPRDGHADDRPAERGLTRSCVHCGETFRPTRKHQLHCRPSCQRTAFQARQELKQRCLFPELLEDALCRVPFE